MTDALIAALITEVRDEKNIPSFVSDASIKNYILQANDYLQGLVASVDYDTDFTARGFLKDYVYYANSKMVDVFIENFRVAIFEWQMSKVSTEAYTSEVTS